MVYYVIIISFTLKSVTKMEHIYMLLLLLLKQIISRNADRKVFDIASCNKRYACLPRFYTDLLVTVTTKKGYVRSLCQKNKKTNT